MQSPRHPACGCTRRLDTRGGGLWWIPEGYNVRYWRGYSVEYRRVYWVGYWRGVECWITEVIFGWTLEGVCPGGLIDSVGPAPLSSATRGPMAPTRTMATWLSLLPARFASAPATASIIPSVPPFVCSCRGRALAAAAAVSAAESAVEAAAQAVMGSLPNPCNHHKAVPQVDWRCF